MRTKVLSPPIPASASADLRFSRSMPTSAPMRSAVPKSRTVGRSIPPSMTRSPLRRGRGRCRSRRRGPPAAPWAEYLLRCPSRGPCAHRRDDLLLGFLPVEVVSPRRHQAGLVHLDDRRAPDRDPCPVAGCPGRREGATADPLEDRPALRAPDARDLLSPVGKYLARLTGDT